MQYFVSAENIAYYHWQLELLIQSFKIHNLQDSLVIGLANTPQQIYLEPKNLYSHKHVFIHDNIGKEKDCPSFNRIYGLHIAITKNLIKPPFVVIHPDTILVKPFELKSIGITFQMDQEFTPQECRADDFIKLIKNAKKIEDAFWLPLGDTICIENLPDNFIKRVLELTDWLIKTYPKWNGAEKSAWLLTLLEYYGHLTYYGTFGIENTLRDAKLKQLIHYKRGLPPHFNKNMFRFEPPAIFGMGNPYDILLKYNVNKVMDYVGKVITSYMDK